MSVDNSWHLEKYTNDIYDSLTIKEKKRFHYWNRSPQLEYRKHLIIWLNDLARDEKFNINIRHLAVYLLDIFLDNHVVVPEHLKLVASCCLILAAKVEDTVDPLNKKFNTILGDKYELRDFVQMEMKILRFFNYDVMFVTVVNFMEIFSIFTLHPTDLMNKKPIQDFEKVNTYVKKYIAYFMDLVMLENTFYKFTPSIVGAAIILATRFCLSLTPKWPVVLNQFTGYRFDHLYPCMIQLTSKLNTGAICSILNFVPSKITNCCNSVCEPVDLSDSKSVENFLSLPKIVK